MADNPAFRWQDPPKKPLGRSLVWPGRLEPARERIGVWARVWHYDSALTAKSAVYHLRRGMTTGVNPKEWEFVDSDGDVYARYLGPDSGEASG